MQLDPNIFKLEETTIWSFKKRGCWATHSGDYRGNCAPQVVRNLILKYTKVGDVFLDSFCGSGTSLIECKLLNRRSIGIDVNVNTLKIAQNKLKFNCNNLYEPKLVRANSIDLKNIIPDNKIDFIFAHPPYANAIKYSDNIKEDISRLNIDDFLLSMDLFSKKCFRILKKNGICSILIGDIRKNKKIIPIGFQIMNKFLEIGFSIEEIIIKEQHNCKMTEYWKNKKKDFYLLAHEYIFILKK